MSLFIKMFLIFFKIGAIGFGGGYGIISLMWTECQKFLGLTANEFAGLTALDLIVPGPIAINGATYIGYLKGNIQGSIIATVALVIPSFIFVLAALHFLSKFKENKVVQGILTGIKPAVIGIIASAALVIGGAAIFSNGFNVLGVSINWGAIVIFGLSLLLMLKWKVNPIIITILAGILGWVLV